MTCEWRGERSGIARVGVLGAHPLCLRGWWERLLDKAALEDREDACARGRDDPVCALASSFQARFPVMTDQCQQSGPTAIAQLRERLLGEQMIDQTPGSRTDGRRPVAQLLACPLPICTLGCLHVVADRAITSLAERAWVAANAASAVQDFDHVMGHAGVDGPADQCPRKAVEAPVDLDVVVDMHLGALVHRRLVGIARQRSQRRLVHRLQPTAARAVERVEPTLVQVRSQISNGMVHRCETKKDLPSQPSQHPAIDDLNAYLHTLTVSCGCRDRAGSITVPKCSAQRCPASVGSASCRSSRLTSARGLSGTTKARHGRTATPATSRATNRSASRAPSRRRTRNSTPPAPPQNHAPGAPRLSPD